LNSGQAWLVGSRDERNPGRGVHANRTFASIPAGGVLGLRWDASIDQVRKAFPDDRRSGSESTKLSHLGTVELGSPRLPKGVPAPPVPSATQPCLI